MIKSLILPVLALVFYGIKCEELDVLGSSSDNVTEKITLSNFTTPPPTSRPRPASTRLGGRGRSSRPNSRPSSSFSRGGEQLYLQSRYPDHYHIFPKYYAPKDTGTTAFGIYMGAKLASLHQPTFSHRKFYSGNTPWYDHYSVEHHSHMKYGVHVIPPVKLSEYTKCVGDSAEACPQNTTSVCLSETGRLICTADEALTSPCGKVKNTQCVWTTISCVNNPSAECKEAEKSSASAISVELPCFQTLTLEESREKCNDNNGTSSDDTKNDSNYHCTGTGNVTLTKYCITFIAVPMRPIAQSRDHYPTLPTGWSRSHITPVIPVNSMVV